MTDIRHILDGLCLSLHDVMWANDARKRNSSDSFAWSVKKNFSCDFNFVLNRSTLSAVTTIGQKFISTHWYSTLQSLQIKSLCHATSFAIIHLFFCCCSRATVNLRFVTKPLLVRSKWLQRAHRIRRGHFNWCIKFKLFSKATHQIFMTQF